MRIRRWLFGCVLLAPLVAGVGLARDDAKAPKPWARKLLYPALPGDVPAALRPAVSQLLEPDQRAADPTEVKPAGVFVRVLSRKDVLTGDGLQDGATLGLRPFVFVTLPETLFRRSLLEVFSAIGYAADDVLPGEIGQEKVVVVFRWENPVALHPGRDGKLPDAWKAAVYPATWDNLFTLVEVMAADPNGYYVRESDQPRVVTKLELRSFRERQFVLGFPDEGKQNLKCSSYDRLREQKGADWAYRQFLARSMAASEHYKGDGTIRETLARGDPPRVGFPEFVGPNRRLSDLPEIAVIGLGALRVGE